MTLNGTIQALQFENEYNTGLLKNLTDQIDQDIAELMLRKEYLRKAFSDRHAAINAIIGNPEGE